MSLLPTVVQKYGGSSLADVGRLQSIASDVVQRHRAGTRMVVVVSAMGKTTDQLIAQAMSISRAPPRRELDMLVTAGERISMALLSMAIHELGEDAISFTGSQSGIITDMQHQGAQILEVRPDRILASLESRQIVIIAGYQGVSRSREITTLGRGGSDTTAVAMAAALQASACEIYSDVDGVYTADPGICQQARLLRELPYDVMQTMAAAGARVLQADAVEFARRAGITIAARKTGSRSGLQTLIGHVAVLPSGVSAVVGAKNVSLITTEQELPEEFWQTLTCLGARIMFMAPQALLVDRTGVAGARAEPIALLCERWRLHSRAVGVLSLVGSNFLNITAHQLSAWLLATHVAPRGTFAVPGWVAAVVAPDSVDGLVQEAHEAFVVNACGQGEV